MPINLQLDRGPHPAAAPAAGMTNAGQTAVQEEAPQVRNDAAVTVSQALERGGRNKSAEANRVAALTGIRRGGRLLVVAPRHHRKISARLCRTCSRGRGADLLRPVGFLLFRPWSGRL